MMEEINSGVWGTTAIVLLLLLGIELWRRSLRGRTPRWLHVVTAILSLEILVGVVLGTYRAHETWQAASAASPADKASAVARGISSAMESHAIAFAGVALAVIALVAGEIYARRHKDVPTAKLRS